MFKSIFLILLPLYVTSATLSLNIVRDMNQTYSIMHLEDSDTIKCTMKMNDKFKDEVICQFKNPLYKHPEPLENRYFKIDFFDKKIRIFPKYAYEFYPLKKSFIKDDVVDTDKSLSYNHWVIVSFKSKSNLYTKKNSDGLAFPISFKKNDLPSIGELDFDLNPINKNINVNAIIKIKELYKAKKYDKALKEADYLLAEKKSIFTAEAKLFKIRSLDKLIDDSESKSKDDGLDPIDIIDLAQEWIEENPSNMQLPEMYMYIAKTHLKLGKSSKAKKYLDILEREYQDSRYNFLAKLANADKIYREKDKNDAIKKYKYVLYNTKDFDIASMAALKLTTAYIQKKKIQKAKLFFDKVITVNETFVKSHASEAYALAKTFAENNESNVSIQIGTLLEKDIKNYDINADELKKNIAYWYEKSKNNDKAIALYKSYLDKEKYGKYRDFVSERLDKVMLNADEQNETKKLAYLETIMIRYKEDSIYAKALLAKANIYLKNSKYENILQMNGELKKYGGDALLSEVAKKQFAIYLVDKQCNKALNLELEYNLTVEVKQEESAYNCYSQLNKYEKALDISKKNMKSEALDEKLKWTYNSAKIYIKQAKFKALILAADDVDKLQELLKSDKYNDLIYNKIEAYYHLGGYDELMLREVQKCEKLFPDNVKNLDVFEKVLLYAKKRKDTSLVINYAKKMIDLQEKYNLVTYTPKLELDYIKALRTKGRYKEALAMDIKLLYKKLNDKQRAHVLYIAGDLSEKVKKFKEAKEFYTKCGEIVEDTAWVELCSENLQLLEDK